MTEEEQNFQAHVAMLQERHGVELTEAGAQELVDMFRAGTGPEAIEQAFAGYVAEDGGDDTTAAEDDSEEYGQEYDDPGPYGSELVNPQEAQNFQDDVVTELTRLQKTHGRFTQRELEALGPRLLEQAVRDDRIDAAAALKADDEEHGRKPRDEWTLDDRTQRAIELMEDHRRARDDEARDDRPLDIHGDLNDLYSWAQGVADGVEYETQTVEGGEE